MTGLPAMAQAVAEHQRRFYGLEYDPGREVTVYAGATEAIFVSLQALPRPGRRGRRLRALLRLLPAGVAMAGATLRAVTLRAPGLPFDRAELARRDHAPHAGRCS